MIQPRIPVENVGSRGGITSFPKKVTLADLLRSLDHFHADQPIPMADQEFDELLDQASQGDRQAIDQLLQEHMPMLLGYIRLKVNPIILNHETCEDLLQSVCGEVLRHQEDFEYRGQPAFRAWLFMTAVNKIKDRLRYIFALKRDPRRETHVSNWSRSSRIQPRDRSNASPSQMAIRKEDRERLVQTIQKFPPDYHEVIFLLAFSS